MIRNLLKFLKVANTYGEKFGKKIPVVAAGGITSSSDVKNI